MNNKKAKAIRHMVKQGFVGISTDSRYMQNEETMQTVLEPGCFRAIYQRVKRNIKGGSNAH